MKIDKAIEILDLKVKGCNPYLSEVLDDATKLGIEAMNLYRLLKASGDIPQDMLLPGETEE